MLRVLSRDHAVLMRKKLKVKSTRRFYLNKCVNRKFSVMLKKLFVHFKNTHSVFILTDDRALRVREKTGIGPEGFLQISGWR
jgi:hypothetical protein